MSAIDRIERSPFWLLGRILVPARRRAAACIRRGEHRPQIVDMGRSKVCWNCGAW